jgi:hypothetical protein
MGKVKGAQHTTWSHHETMIVNLRDWVRREINTLHLDLSKEVPHLSDDPNVKKILGSAEDMNTQLFDLIRSVVDLAETESKKRKKTEAVVEEKEDDAEFDG